MSVRVLQGHVLSVLASEPAQSVHTCVTSPPYWGLRSYGTPPQVWNGVDGCEHEWGAEGSVSRRGQAAGATAQVGNTVSRVCPPVIGQGAFCQRCGAWRGELGQEPTPDCGRHGRFRLRRDLTSAQREYVAQRLRGVAPRDVGNGGTDGTA